jgi:hypothetical protein
MLFAILGLGVTLFDESLKLAEFLIFGLMAVCGLLLTLVPGIAALRVYRAIKHGHLGDAEVISVVYEPPGSTTTLDSIQNGFARGKWRIIAPGKIIDEDFEVDESWASSLEPGKHIRVLFNLKASHVMHALGPVDRRLQAGT